MLVDALLIMKKPLSLLIALIALIAFIILALSSSVDFVLAGVSTLDVCKLPFASRVSSSCTPPRPETSMNIVPTVHGERADFPSLIAVQHRALEELIGFSGTGSDLAVNLKHAELAVQDLIILVKASTLSVKEELAQALTDFVVDAKGAARGLNDLSSKISGTTDEYVLRMLLGDCQHLLTFPLRRLLAYNDVALRTLESATPDGSRSTLALSFWSSMNGFSAQITRVLVQAAATSVSLDRLE